MHSNMETALFSTKLLLLISLAVATGMFEQMWCPALIATHGPMLLCLQQFLRIIGKTVCSCRVQMHENSFARGILFITIWFFFNDMNWHPILYSVVSWQWRYDDDHIECSLKRKHDPGTKNPDIQWWQYTSC